MGQWVAAIMAALAVGGQAANLVLNLKLRAGQLESEKRVLDEVAKVYMREDVYRAEMGALEKRVCS